MTVVIRVDASELIGTGHITRSMALAEALRTRGAQVRFVCRAHPGNFIGVLKGKGLPVSALAALPTDAYPVGEDYAAWLGVPQAVDAAQTIGALDGGPPDWLVVDHYGLGAEWERLLRPHVGKLLVIDDLADRDHDCDVLLDQTYSDPSVHRHDGLVPEACQLLVGPRYALLAPQYGSYRHALAGRDGHVRRVLVYFGGTDPRNMTSLVLAVLSTPEFSHLDVDVVIGTNSANRVALERQAAQRPRTHVHGTRAHLADLMVHADVAIGAGGVTTWERMCLGVPSLVVCLAANQRSTCEALSAAGLIQYVGDVSAVGKTEIAIGLRQLIGGRDRLLELSARGLECVDGQGAARVAEVMGGQPARPRVLLGSS